MFRKTSVALAALLVASTAVIAPAAQAATKISNGVTCAKKGAKVAVGAKTYLCTTNPVATGSSASKLVWVWNLCVSANTSYLDANKKYTDILNQIKTSANGFSTSIQNSINAMILWKPTKNYLKDDVVYVTGATYYVALNSSSNKAPSSNLGTLWAVYQPTADPNVGTSPTPTQVVEWKKRDVVDWTETVTKLSANLTKLQGYKNPDAKTTALIKQTQSLINTLNIGIKNANTNIRNLQNNVLYLSLQETNKATATALKSLVDDAKKLRAVNCAIGK